MEMEDKALDLDLKRPSQWTPQYKKVRKTRPSHNLHNQMAMDPNPICLVMAMDLKTAPPRMEVAEVMGTAQVGMVRMEAVRAPEEVMAQADRVVLVMVQIPDHPAPPLGPATGNG